MSKLTLVVDTTIQGVAALIEEIKAKQKQALNTALQGIADAVHEAGTPLKVVIYGYTPSWNDGEECTHSQSVFVTKQGAMYEDLFDRLSILHAFRDEILGDDETAEDSEELLCEKFFGPQEKAYKVADLKKVEQLFVELEDLVAQTYGGTNFQLVFNFDPLEGLKVENEYYDPGY